MANTKSAANDDEWGTPGTDEIPAYYVAQCMWTMHVTGAPLIYVRRTVWDAAGLPVEYIQALYRPDRYEYHMNMKRISRSGQSFWSAEPS